MKIAGFGILMVFLFSLASCATYKNETSRPLLIVNIGTSGCVGARLQYAVTIDGRMSSASEWSDTSPIDSHWGLGFPLASPFVHATVWAKNDDTWVYLLYRIEWPSADADIDDEAQISHFWGQYVPPWENSDLGCVCFAGSSWGGPWDAYGWDDTQWYSDADDGGEVNVEGTATYDGTHYWFEFRKELSSGDGHDWSFRPGEGYTVLAGLWDNSIGREYHASVELHLY